MNDKINEAVEMAHEVEMLVKAARLLRSGLRFEGNSLYFESDKLKEGSKAVDSALRALRPVAAGTHVIVEVAPLIPNGITLPDATDDLRRKLRDDEALTLKERMLLSAMIAAAQGK